MGENTETKEPIELSLFEGLTDRETIFVKKYVENVLSPSPRPLYRVAEASGYSKNSAPASASRVIDNPKVQRSIQALMAEYGLSDADLLKKHRELIHAKVPVIFKGKLQKDDEGNTILLDDAATQRQALDMAYKLKGVYASDRAALIQADSVSELLSSILGDGEELVEVIDLIEE